MSFPSFACEVTVVPLKGSKNCDNAEEWFLVNFLQDKSQFKKSGTQMF